MMTTDRRTPVLTLPDGRAIHGLVKAQRTAIELLLMRYYTWVAAGRRSDPWASGAGQGQSYQPRVTRGAPVGGYGPGTAADPEGADDSLLALDRALPKLEAHQRRLLAWRYVDRFAYVDMAERLGRSVDWTVIETTRTLTTLYYQVCA